MSKLFQLENLSQSYKAMLQNDNVSITDILDLADSLIKENFTEEVDVCLKKSVELMMLLVKKNKIDEALTIENRIYVTFVRSREHEQHYYDCFKLWSSGFQECARSLDLPEIVHGRNRKVCFILQNAVLLGHTGVMLRVIDEWVNSGKDVEIYVAALGIVDPKFMGMLSKRGVTFMHLCGENLGESPPPAQAILSLRDNLQKMEIFTTVWVSLATHASFALALPLSPRQVFWSLKFHPIYIDEVSHHICGGHSDEKFRVYHEKSWDVCPFPLTVSLKENRKDDIKKIRRKLSDDAVLLGTLARDEKYNSLGYLSAVGAIMSNNPQCHFLWAGIEPLPKMLEAFEAYGVSDRCHFVGWVDTNLYAEALDIFLETFPFGCGVTGFQAMGQGTPLLSFNAPDTMYGYQLQGANVSTQGTFTDTEKKEYFEGLPILTAINLTHYIELAQRLIDDVDYRAAISQRELLYYNNESATAGEYSSCLLDLILEY